MKEETEQSTDEIPIESSPKEETKDAEENEEKNSTKHVQIDEDKNDEKTYR